MHAILSSCHEEQTFHERLLDLTRRRSDLLQSMLGFQQKDSFIKKENQSEVVRLAKTLAAYNWGRGNLSRFLSKLKEEGKVDMYNSLDWVKQLPLETSDYINKILLKKDPKFEKEFEKAIKSDKNKKIVSIYNNLKNPFGN